MSLLNPVYNKPKSNNTYGINIEKQKIIFSIIAISPGTPGFPTQDKEFNNSIQNSAIADGVVEQMSLSSTITRMKA